MRDLTPAVLNAFDLDSPEDTLTFAVAVPPAHGALLHAIYGMDASRYEDMGPRLLRQSLPVTSFTMRELKQGEPVACGSVCVCGGVEDIVNHWGTWMEADIVSH